MRIIGWMLVLGIVVGCAGRKGPVRATEHYDETVDADGLSLGVIRDPSRPGVVSVELWDGVRRRPQRRFDHVEAGAPIFRLRVFGGRERFNEVLFLPMVLPDGTKRTLSVQLNNSEVWGTADLPRVIGAAIRHVDTPPAADGYVPRVYFVQHAVVDGAPLVWPLDFKGNLRELKNRSVRGFLPLGVDGFGMWAVRVEHGWILAHDRDLESTSSWFAYPDTQLGDFTQFAVRRLANIDAVFMTRPNGQCTGVRLRTSSAHAHLVGTGATAATCEEVAQALVDQTPKLVADADAVAVREAEFEANRVDLKRAKATTSYHAALAMGDVAAACEWAHLLDPEEHAAIVAMRLSSGQNVTAAELACAPLDGIRNGVALDQLRRGRAQAAAAEARGRAQAEAAARDRRIYAPSPGSRSTPSSAYSDPAYQRAVNDYLYGSGKALCPFADASAC